ncbi:TrkH-domain-containing protein [Fistulina hepatica ATCC 64428]|uniref:TrkH-domain-containing protein n=1 Tax=Fistulina hepatica ATCC 64428 TaxID=1128425 RepID=A0A0D7A5E2_9AGAR|nr:TrkH-domain-containing protein [Fistulina hepatica ATCC 64428]
MGLSVCFPYWPIIRRHLNFYRIHTLVFIFVPLIGSGIFYACNGDYHVDYIDGLFLCVSSMTVCGLATTDLSHITTTQQVVLFVLMLLGCPVFVSLVMLSIRKHYFEKKFVHLIEAARRMQQGDDREGVPLTTRIRTFITRGRTATLETPKPPKRSGRITKLNAAMIRRTDDVPRRVDPNGLITEKNTDEHDFRGYKVPSQPATGGRHPKSVHVPIDGHPNSDTGTTAPDSDTARDTDTTLAETIAPVASAHLIATFPTPADFSRGDDRESRFPAPSSVAVSNVPMNRALTSQTYSEAPPAADRPMTRDFGGFPMPWTIAKAIIGRLFPRIRSKLRRTLTVPMTTTIHSMNIRDESLQGIESRAVPYISFEAVVGRNSNFHMLTQEQLEELGGIEYRGLRVLLWIVSSYHIVVQLVGFVIIAPYISRPEWSWVFRPPELYNQVAAPWFALFQTISTYTNSGMSLVDESMVPFQTAYVMIVVMVFLILAGNTAYVRFLIIFALLTDFLCFLVLDIGTPAIEAIPIGTRVANALIQAVAVRAAGFAIVPLSVLAPAVKVMYVIMMYISVCETDVRHSVRSTNVYEDQTFGVFPDEEEKGRKIDRQFAASNLHAQSRMSVWGRYLASHARKQLAFDMWWLGLSLFLICIIERAGIEDTANCTWFNEFTILFELVSAYGSVGLSLGVENQNYSLSGAFKPLSKLVMCAVMIRGRHRGLPVAIDRAVLLPQEFKWWMSTQGPTSSGAEGAVQMTGTVNNNGKVRIMVDGDNPDHGHPIPRTTTILSGHSLKENGDQNSSSHSGSLRQRELHRTSI